MWLIVIQGDTDWDCNVLLLPPPAKFCYFNLPMRGGGTGLELIYAQVEIVLSVLMTIVVISSYAFKLLCPI